VPRHSCGRCASRRRYLPLLRFLAHLGDHRIAGHRGEEAVDVNRRKALGKSDVLFRREVLVAEKDDAVFAERAADLGEGFSGDRPVQIDPVDLCADICRHRLDPDLLVCHVILPAKAAPD